jgi:hypothetical protein
MDGVYLMSFTKNDGTIASVVVETNPIENDRCLEKAGEAYVMHAKMYVIADKYQVLGLKDVALEKFDRVSRFRHMYNRFYSAIDIAFEGTPANDRGLRVMIARFIHEDLQIYGLTECIQQKLNAYPELACRLLEMQYSPKV